MKFLNIDKLYLATDEFEKFAAKIKSNDRMPALSKSNIDEMMKEIEDWDSKYKNQALKFADKITPKGLFQLLHGMRRWYTGQTMARLIRSYRNDLKEAMDLEPEDAVGIFRGFKVPEDSFLAKYNEGDEFSLKVTRNHGFSSWTTSKEMTNRFSGKSPGKIGLIVKLIDSKNVVPILAPPNKTSPWFNALYEKVIGKSFRPNEGEYLLSGSGMKVKVIRVKK